MITTDSCTNNKTVTILGNNHIISNNIINEGVLTIKDLTFKDCVTTAIETNNELHIDNCSFINNGNCDHTNEIIYGGAIHINNKNNSTTIKNCLFDGNKAPLYGGAIYSTKTIKLSGETIIMGNEAQYGGAIYIENENTETNALIISNFASKIIQNAMEMREHADYEDFFVASKKDAEEQISKAEQFLEYVKVFLDNKKAI